MLHLVFREGTGRQARERTYFMGNILRPKMCAHMVKDIDFAMLAQKGYRYAMLDFDNTLAPDHLTEPIDYSYEMINLMKKNGFSLCLVSNAKSDRSKGIAEKLGIPCVTYAHKPRPTGVFSGMEKIGATPSETVMIGDQIFTDVIAGNRAGVYTILVDRYSKKEVFYVVLKRFPEWIVRKICRF